MTQQNSTTNTAHLSVTVNSNTPTVGGKQHDKRAEVLQSAAYHITNQKDGKYSESTVAGRRL